MDECRQSDKWTFLHFFNSDINSFGSKNSCLRGWFGFKRHFLFNSFHRSKLKRKKCPKSVMFCLNGSIKRSLKCKFVREEVKHYLTEISKVKMKCHFIFQFLANWQVQSLLISSRLISIFCCHNNCDFYFYWHWQMILRLYLIKLPCSYLGF